MAAAKKTAAKKAAPAVKKPAPKKPSKNVTMGKMSSGAPMGMGGSSSQCG